MTFWIEHDALSKDLYVVHTEKPEWDKQAREWQSYGQIILGSINIFNFPPIRQGTCTLVDISVVPQSPPQTLVPPCEKK